MLTKKPVSRNDWNTVPMSSEGERIEWERTFSAEEYRLIKLGYRPESGSDDWFAYFEDDTFFIHLRSGQCVCSFEISPVAENHRIVNAVINKRLLGPSISEKPQRLVDELLRWIALTEHPAARTDWKVLPMPEQKARLDLSIDIPVERYEQLQWGFIPRAMEDHWFNYMEEDRLYLHRSWTGFCIYEISFEPTQNGYHVREVWVNRSPDQYKGTDEQDVNWLRRFLRG